MHKRTRAKRLGGSVSVFLTVLCFACCSVDKKQPGNPAQDKTPPNFVVIFTDDQGYGDLGCYGNTRWRTPYIDRMAREGVRFTDFYVAAAVCTPSRAALLTGCYAQRVGLPSVLWPNAMSKGQQDGNALGINPQEITMAELLKKAGYATACIGKWHLGDMPPYMPLNNGFDEYFGLPYSNDMIPENTKHDFDSIPLYDNTRIIEKNPDQDLLTKRYTEKAVDFIQRHRGTTFFLYLAHTMPHRPCHVSDSLANLRFTGSQLARISGENKESRDFLYPAVIEELDWSVGVILDALREYNLESNTLVVFTSDNGPATGTAGPLRGKKGSMYEGGLRVPCVMYWPGQIPAGAVVSQIAASIDLYPTFAHLAGIDLPGDRIIDGTDITGLILGKTTESVRQQFFYFDQGRGLKAVRGGDWKLFLSDEPRLYNLGEDIGESNNVAATYPEIVEQLTSVAGRFENELEDNKRKPGLLPL